MLHLKNTIFLFCLDAKCYDWFDAIASTFLSSLQSDFIDVFTLRRTSVNRHFLLSDGTVRLDSKPIGHDG